MRWDLVMVHDFLEGSELERRLTLGCRIGSGRVLGSPQLVMEAPRFAASFSLHHCY
jgi:hypothetical protein